MALMGFFFLSSPVVFLFVQVFFFFQGWAGTDRVLILTLLNRSKRGGTKTKVLQKDTE